MLTAQKNPLKDVKETIHQAQEKCCDKAQEVREDLREAAHNAGQKVREIYDTATHQGRDATAAVERQIRRNPLAAGAAAAGIGFMLGLLFRRR
jgi:ElaB/YqjD/DUF883 family membrane-anchored ribosome-binding protein